MSVSRNILCRGVTLLVPQWIAVQALKVKNNYLNGNITKCSQRDIILYSVRQHSHFII